MVIVCIEHCSKCGRELNALNMSDVEGEEDKCRDCITDILEKMDTNDESNETKWLSDKILNKLTKKRGNIYGRSIKT